MYGALPALFFLTYLQLLITLTLLYQPPPRVMQVSREGAAATLLGLLDTWVKQCNMWDDHNDAVIAGRYKNVDAEADEYRRLQTEYMLPFMQKCVDKGFKYADLSGIIPSGFKTDWKQRQDQLAALNDWVDEEFCYDEPPF